MAENAAQVSVEQDVEFAADVVMTARPDSEQPPNGAVGPIGPHQEHGASGTWQTGRNIPQLDRHLSVVLLEPGQLSAKTDLAQTRVLDPR